MAQTISWPLVALTLAATCSSARAQAPYTMTECVQELRQCELDLDVTLRRLEGERLKVRAATVAIDLHVQCPPIPQCQPEPACSCLFPSLVATGISGALGLFVGSRMCTSQGPVVIR